MKIYKIPKGASILYFEGEEQEYITDQDWYVNEYDIKWRDDFAHVYLKNGIPFEIDYINVMELLHLDIKMSIYDNSITTIKNSLLYKTL